jgi:hypothetical protein
VYTCCLTGAVFFCFFFGCRYGGPAYEGNKGCAIEWLPGKNVTKQEVEKKQRKKKGKGAGETRLVKRVIDQDSFFHFFTDLPPMPKEPTSEKEEEVSGPFALSRILLDCVLSNMRSLTGTYHLRRSARLPILTSKHMWFLCSGIWRNRKYVL